MGAGEYLREGPDFQDSCELESNLDRHTGNFARDGMNKNERDSVKEIVNNEKISVANRSYPQKKIEKKY